MLRIYAAIALCLALGAGGWYLHHRWFSDGVAHEQAIEAAQAAKYNAKARETEQAQAKLLADVAIRYEQDKAHAKVDADRTIAELRAGTVRLRREWTCPATPATASDAGRPDGETQLREQGASDLVRLAAEADAQIRGLQQVLIDERKP